MAGRYAGAIALTRSHAQTLWLGVDFGTSGCRACAINEAAEIVALESVTMEAPKRHGSHIEQDPEVWWKSLITCFKKLSYSIDLKSIKKICVNGTSGTVLACEPSSRPLGQALMYNDSRARQQAQSLQGITHPAASASSSLCKALWMQQHLGLGHAVFVHQSDWISWLLTGSGPYSDTNNALKLGYDPARNEWCEWLPDSIRACLPRVLEPGTTIGPITTAMAKRLGFSEDCQISIGTTDSIAALIASGAHEPGEAVTSLGSTLVLKLLSPVAVEDRDTGVYSHRLGDIWLCGGASNSGGQVLRHFFSDNELEQLSLQINPEQDSAEQYYPLLQTGERFPINDPDRPAKLQPRPANDAEFLHGLLQGMAAIEQRGYALLAQLGAPYPKRIISAGGGAKNPVWRALRQRLCGVPVSTAQNSEACYGSALLALRGLAPFKLKQA